MDLRAHARQPCAVRDPRERLFVRENGFGYARECDVERNWREARLFQIAPISTKLVLAYIGEYILGMPRSY